MHFPLIFTSAILCLVYSTTGTAHHNAGLFSLRQYIPPGGPVDTTTTPVPGEETADEQINAKCLERFNLYRALHGTQNLTYNPALQAIADACAEYYVTEKTAAALEANADILQLSLVEKCKENVGERGHHFGINADEPVLSDVPFFVSRTWYNEKNGFDGTTPPLPPYNYATPDRDSLIYYTDFTAMIWNSTTSFACAVSSKTAKSTRFLSVIYEPIGNVVPDGNLETYIQNVPPLK